MATPVVEALDADGRSLGYTVDINEALAKGLWYRAVHALIYRPTGEVLIERRSQRIVTHPGLLDISLGGIVDPGETTLEALLRELREELGLAVAPNQVEYIGLSRYNHRWPRLRRSARCLVSSYLVRLDASQDHLALQPSEVAEARFVPLATAQRLVQRHRLLHLGRLEPRYGRYRRLLALVAERLNQK